jgi:hypothetical protein
MGITSFTLHGISLEVCTDAAQLASAPLLDRLRES